MTNSLLSLIPAILLESEEYNRLWLEATPFACHTLDTGGVIREVNQAECELLGYTPEQLIGRPVWDFVAPEELQTVRDTVARKMARLQPVSIIAREYRRGDGSYVWLEIHEKLIENAGGDVVGMRSALLDITERHKFDLEVQREHNWMKLVLRSIGSAVVAADSLGNIEFMNPAAEILTGWLLQEAAGRPLEDVCSVWYGHGEPIELMSCILAGPMISNRSHEFVIVDRLGAPHSVIWNISPIFRDGGAITGTVLTLEKR